MEVVAKFWDDRDRTLEGWPLMDKPWLPLAMPAVYATLVTVIGPKLMENRKPFNLKTPILIYNLYQVLASCYIFYESVMAGWGTHYSWTCQPVTHNVSPNHRDHRMAKILWFCIINRYIELLDTFFFVARKKNSQVTFLHVYHHAVVPLLVYSQARWYPNGHETFILPMNAFIHIVMYSYYFLAAQGPWIQPYLWWKKYITTIQLIQFTLGLIHDVHIVFGFSQCYNHWENAVFCNIICNLPLLILFSNFYIQSYIKKAQQKKKVV